MMGGMNIARHIIDDVFGGTRAVQGVLDDGTPYTTIQSWKDKGSIPAKRQEDQFVRIGGCVRHHVLMS